MDKNCLRGYFQFNVICIALSVVDKTLLCVSNYNSFYTVNPFFKKTKL